MNPVSETLGHFGGDPAAVLWFDDDIPELLPYATLVSAQRLGDETLGALRGVYVWQGRPLIFLVDGQHINQPGQVQRLQRIAAMRGDAPYVGIVRPGKLSVYRARLEGHGSEEPIDLGDTDQGGLIPYLANTRPSTSAQRHWITDVVLRLLTASLKSLTHQGVRTDDAISLVGRALFLRFLADRDLLPNDLIGDDGAASVFDGPQSALVASAWLDRTFNGDFLPISPQIFNDLNTEVFVTLGNILRRAPEGQLQLGWSERWDNLDFAHIPVGVLSQAHERYLSHFHRKRQQREGSYYTPRHIADLMVRGAFEALRRNGAAISAKVLDPAAGAGVFLLTAFRELVAERWRATGVRPNTEQLREILYNQISGMDINEAALRFAALGLYLISIELDPEPEPVQKLRFDNLRPNVLRHVGPFSLFNDVELASESDLGSLGRNVNVGHEGRYDLVVGNPPWVTATKLKDWGIVQEEVNRIARERLGDDTICAPLPNEVVDLPFVWRAMEWARPGGQIAFALHARVLFLQGEGMPEARRMLFEALDVTGVINGTELRATNVWPEVTAPFCLLFATNARPGPGAGFRFVTPRLEKALNRGGLWRIDAANAEVVASEEVRTRPELLKVLFRGSRLDLEVLERLKGRSHTSLREYKDEKAGTETPLANSGNGYQLLRRSSTRDAHGEFGHDASHLIGLPVLTASEPYSLEIEARKLPKFSLERLHRSRSRDIFRAPLLLIREAPSVRESRILVSVAEEDVVFSQSYQGYSAARHPNARHFVRYLALVIGSSTALWFALMTSGRFGFERDVVEKFTIERLPIPRYEELSSNELACIDGLFEGLSRQESGARENADAWVCSIYSLSNADYQVIRDTLAYNLPFARNQSQAQQPTSSSERKAFGAALQSELRAWTDHLGFEAQVAEPADAQRKPWRFLRVGRSERTPTVHKGWFEATRAADFHGVTEITYWDEGSVWIGRLDQARYWSPSQARLVARDLIWDPAFLTIAGRA